MGYNLWASGIARHRGVGTSILEVRQLFINGINVRTICEELNSYPSKSDALQAKRDLKNNGFDVAGLENESRNLIGFVQEKDLEAGVCGDYKKEFNSKNLISDSTPITHLLEELSKSRYLFVLTGSSVTGIVTVADLNKPPVRIYLFGIISMLEMYMTYWISKHYEGNEWMNYLPKARVSEAENQYRQLIEKNEEIQMVNCIQFADKKTLVAKNQGIRNLLELGGRDRVENNLRYAEELRNNLAHSQEDLAGKKSWAEIYNTVKWIEDFLIKSDSASKK